MARSAARVFRALLFGALLLCAAVPARAQEAFPVVVPTLPNYVAFGLGFTTDYLGADEAFFGGLPLARYEFEGTERYASLLGTYADVNVLNNPVLRFGLTGQYRFGRSDVDDDAVRRLPVIDSTLEAGVFGALEFVDDADPRRRLRLDARVQHDLLGEHDGLIASAGIQGWHPVRNWFEGVVALGMTYGSADYMSTYFDVRAADSAQSGLDAFEADGGFRDVRLTLGAMVPVTHHVLVGAGLMLMRLVGDAADSPIVDDAGSPNQLSGGIGAAYAW
jgi:outer membrane protein